MATIRAEPVSAPSFCAGSNQENGKKLSEVFKTEEKYDIMPRKNRGFLFASAFSRGQREDGWRIFEIEKIQQR